MIKAKYTVVLKTLLDDPTIKSLIDKALSTYPLYVKKSKEEYIPSYIPTREELNTKILNHYKYREIGTETIEGFLDRLETTMNEIMPRYNLLYLTTDQDFNIIFNVDYKKTIDTNRDDEGSISNESTSNGTNTSESNDSTSTQTNINNFNKAVTSSTPQGQLGIANTGIDSVNYADQVSWNHDTNTDSGRTSGTSTAESSSTLSGTNNTSSTNSQTENTIETTKGNFGVVSAQDLILKYREAIINIDQMIINDSELSDLFMNIY